MERWIKCWKKCEPMGELVVVHNYDEGTNCYPYEHLCQENNIEYIKRLNVGMDIGAMQDVMNGLPYHILFWVTDDVIPMKKDFLKTYVEALTPDVGVVGMEISNFKSHHLRTTAFCIRKDVSDRLQFPALPVTTKAHCYDFEHGQEDNMLMQVERMGLKVVQIKPLKESLLWDTEITRFQRMEEHRREFE